MVDEMKDGCGLGQMKDGTIFGTKEADVRATSLCVRQSFDPFLSFRPLGLIINFEKGIFDTPVLLQLQLNANMF